MSRHKGTSERQACGRTVSCERAAGGECASERAAKKKRNERAAPPRSRVGPSLGEVACLKAFFDSPTTDPPSGILYEVNCPVGLPSSFLHIGA